MVFYKCPNCPDLKLGHKKGTICHKVSNPKLVMYALDRKRFIEKLRKVS